MLKVAIAGEKQILAETVKSLMSEKEIEITSIIPTTATQISDPGFQKLGASIIPQPKLYDKIDARLLDDSPDLLLTVTYFKKVPRELTDKLLCLNVHSGILPFWRGLNSNLWAILNGATSAGYSIHQMSDIYDGGDIYHILEAQVSDFSNFHQLSSHLLKELAKIIPTLLQDICRTKLLPIAQQGRQYTYTAKMLPKDGLIGDWNYEVDFYHRLFYIFGHDHGSGVFLIYKKEPLRIHALTRIEGLVGHPICVPGSVVYTDSKRRIGIQVKNGILVIESLKINGQILAAADVLRLGDRL